jgi:signal transduction histidine kinase/AraC-like DNA-binding protein
MTKYRIAIQVGMYDEYWIQVRDAVVRQALQRDIELVSLNTMVMRDGWNTQLSLSEIDEYYEELMVQHIDALICSSLIEPLLQRILAKHVVVVDASESMLRLPLFTSRRGLYDAAHTVGRWLGERLRAPANVLVVGGNDELGTSRLTGIRTALATHPGITIIHVPCTWDYPDGLTAVHAWATNNPHVQIDAIFGISDPLALAGRDALAQLQRLPAHTLVTGINGDPAALADIERGRMHMTVETIIDSFAAQLIDLALYGIRSRQLPDTYDPPRRVIERHNVAQIAVEKLISLAGITGQLIGGNRASELRRLKQLETSIAITQRVGMILDHAQLMDAINELIKINYGYDRIWLWRFDQDGNLWCDDAPTPALRDSILGATLREQRAMFIPDTQLSTRFRIDAHTEHIRTRIVVPIRFNNTITGLLDLQSTTLLPHTHDELEGLQLVADQVGIVLQNIALYQAARTAQHAAEQADRLKTRLLANVSHELRTPLHIILGYSQLLLNEHAPTAHSNHDTIRDDVITIQRSADHLIHLINDLLDLSRAEIDELVLFPEALDPHDLCTQLFAALSTTLQTATVAWRLDIPSQLPVLYADPKRIRQVITNLLSNAAKFTDHGVITLGVRTEPPYMHIWVHDTGLGINIADQHHIFEPFVTIDNTQTHPQGVGLGLAITRRIVALHHGILTVDSAKGQGSTFHVYLPLQGLAGPAPQPLQHLPLPACIVVLGAQTAAMRQLAHDHHATICDIQHVAELEHLMNTHHITAICWDNTQHIAESTVFDYIQHHAVLRHIPFLLYHTDTQTPLINKPVQNASFADTIKLIAADRQQAAIRVTIIDDHADMHALYRDSMQRVFPQAQITSYYDGASAQAQLAQGEIPDVIVLDLVMPHIDGFAVLAWIRADSRLCDVPVIIVSGKVLSRQEIQQLNFPKTVMRPKLGSDLSTMGELIGIVTSSASINPPHLSIAARHAMAFIQHNFAERLSREQIAHAAGVSESYLTQLFQHELGVTPWVFLTRYRIANACQRIRTSAESITDIALAVGFDDPGYFSKVFRNEIGMTPREYRNQHV